MNKLRWQIEADYDYLDSLDNRGWIWEFIRRGRTYPQVYEALMSEGTLDSQAVFAHFPDKISGESDPAWMLRAADSGIVAKQLTQIQVEASRWMLNELYDPSLVFNPEQIIFNIRNPFPAFFGSVNNPGTADTENLAQTDEINFINQVRPLSDLDSQNGFLADESVLFVAISRRQNIETQLKKINEFITPHLMPMKIISTGSQQMPKWKRYIRAMDAKTTTDGLSMAKKIQIIYPSGTAGSPDYSALEPKAISGFASSQVAQGNEMAESGFRRLLFEEQYR